MKKFLTIILAAVMLVVSVPFAVSAEDVSPMALKCMCTTPSIDKDYVDLGNGYHAINCPNCGAQIGSAKHALSNGKSCGGDGVYCIYCYCDDDIDHILEDNMCFNEYVHGTGCTRDGCEYNPLTDGSLPYSNYGYHYSLDPIAYTNEYYSGELWHVMTWYCVACPYWHYEDAPCKTQNPNCTGGCLIDY